MERPPSSSPWQMSTGWSSKLLFLNPSLTHFPKHINRCSLDIFRVRTLREGSSFLRFSLFKLCSIYRVRFSLDLLDLGFFCEDFSL